LYIAYPATVNDLYRNPTKIIYARRAPDGLFGGPGMLSVGAIVLILKYIFRQAKHFFDPLGGLY